MDDIRVVLAKIEGGVSSLQDRFDDHRHMAQQQHAENVARLQRIEAEVRTTNGRVNGHDSAISRLEERVKTLFADHVDGPLTFEGAKRTMMVAGWIVAGVLWVLHAIGKL